MSTKDLHVDAEAQGGEKFTVRWNSDASSCPCSSLADCIEASMPTSGSQEALEKALFRFIRALKGFAHETKEYVCAINSKGQLDPQFLLKIQALDRWTTAAKIRLAVELDDSAIMVLFWERVHKARTPLGRDLLPRARELAQRMQTTIELDRLRLPAPLLKLAKYCAALQLVNPAKDIFFLACRDAAKALNIDPRTANSYLSALTNIGVLRLVSKGRQTPDGGLASQFQFLLPIPPLLDGVGI